MALPVGSPDEPGDYTATDAGNAAAEGDLDEAWSEYRQQQNNMPGAESGPGISGRVLALVAAVVVILVGLAGGS